MKVKSFQFRETLCRCERQTIDKLVKRVVPATYNFSHCALIPQLPDQYCRCVIIRRIEVQLQCILDIATTHAQFVKWDRICGQLFVWSIFWCPYNWSDNDIELTTSLSLTVSTLSCIHCTRNIYYSWRCAAARPRLITHCLRRAQKFEAKHVLLSVSLSRPRKNWASATQLCFVSFMKVVPRNNY